MTGKVRISALEAVSLIPNGADIAIGGFGNAGVPRTLCNALSALDRRDLHVVSNNAGIDNTGVGKLAYEGRLRKFTGSFPRNLVFAESLMKGEAELELVPQGTLAERLRAAGAGIPAFYTPTSAGTILADGSFPAIYDADGSPTSYMPRKEVRRFDDMDAVLEYALHVDFALVKAHRADSLGNLVFRRASRNFNPMAAMAARTTIVEVEHLVPAGEIDPDEVHLPGIYVDYLVQSDESESLQAQEVSA